MTPSHSPLTITESEPMSAIADDAVVGRFQQETKSGATNMAVSLDGRQIVTCGGDAKYSRGYVQIWGVKNKRKESSE